MDVRLFSRNLAFGVGLLVSTAAGATAQQLVTWRVDSVPLRTVGEDGRTETEFLRIVGAWRVSGDRIVVANNASGEMRVFGPDGRLERTLGRKGSGPGEFQFMRWTWRMADTLFAFDPVLKRITWFDLAAPSPVAQSLQVTADGGRESLEIHGRLTGDSWLAKSSSMVGWTSPPGVQRKPDGIGVVAGAAEGRVRWIADVPGMAGFVFNPTGNLEQALLGPTAFAPVAMATASGGVIWYGESATPEVMRADPASGRPLRIRLPIETQVPTREIVAARRAEEESSDPRGDRAFRDAKFSARYLPKSLPYFEELVPAPDGGIWIQGYVVRRRAQTPHIVLDRAGAVLARVLVPAGLRVTDIGRDYILGVHKDEDGVESVRMYRLSRD